VDEQKLTSLLDRFLKELNDDYAVERNHALREVIVKILPSETFYE